MESQLEILVPQFIQRFTGILWEALPFIVLGAIIAGILEELLPQQVVAKVMPRSRLLGIAIGGLLGLLFPMCECGIIPVMRRLLRKGVPLSSCVAYLLAGPIINVVVMLSTYVAFLGMDADAAGQASHQFGGTLMVGLRMGFGYLVAMGTALIVEWQYRKHGTALLAPAAVADTKAADLASTQQQVQETIAGGTALTTTASPAQARRPSVMQRLGNISQIALHDFIDITVYLVLGAILAAVIRLAFSHQQMESWSQQNAPLAILTMMGLAIIMCLCSEADAFVAASFKPFIPAAKLGFLVLGPMLDFKLYMMYTRVFRPRLIWTIIVSVAVQVFLYSLLVHYVWNAYVQYKFGTP